MEDAPPPLGNTVVVSLPTVAERLHSMHSHNGYMIRHPKKLTGTQLTGGVDPVLTASFSFVNWREYMYSAAIRIYSM